MTPAGKPGKCFSVGNAWSSRHVICIIIFMLSLFIFGSSGGREEGGCPWGVPSYLTVKLCFVLNMLIDAVGPSVLCMCAGVCVCVHVRMQTCVHERSWQF